MGPLARRVELVAHPGPVAGGRGRRGGARGSQGAHADGASAPPVRDNPVVRMNRRRSTGSVMGPPGRPDPSPTCLGLRSPESSDGTAPFRSVHPRHRDRELMADGGIVHLSPKAFDLLEILVQKRPAAVPRAEWRSGSGARPHVSDTSLAGLVGELRKALGDQGRPAGSCGRCTASDTRSAGRCPRPSVRRRRPSSRGRPFS